MLLFYIFSHVVFTTDQETKAKKSEEGCLETNTICQTLYLCYYYIHSSTYILT